MLNNFSTDKESAGTDAFYNADVMDFHMKPECDGGSGMFDDVDEIIMRWGSWASLFVCSDGL